MYQLLLVDDEEATLQGLASLNWSELGFEHVYCAYSAREAMNYLSIEAIDIVVTDIRMPGKSGIELLSDIKSSNVNPKCILLSGHSDFAYAQAAIKADAVDYLLKPVSDEELLETVKKALQKRKQELSERYIHDRSIEAIKTHIDYIGQSIFKPWLTGEKEREHLRAELQAYGIPHSDDVQTIWLFVQSSEQELLYEQLSPILTKVFSEKAVLIRQQAQSNQLSLLLYPLYKKDVPIFHSLMMERVFIVKKEIKKGVHHPISIQLGESVLFWQDAQESFQSKEFSHLKTDEKQEQLANRVRDYVEAHMVEQPNLQEVASYLYMNPAYISKRFKEETGETFTDYTHRLRMKRAVTLLADTNLKVGRISKELGYKDSSYFIRVFKREFNQTPHEFRNR